MGKRRTWGELRPQTLCGFARSASCRDRHGASV